MRLRLLLTLLTLASCGTPAMGIPDAGPPAPFTADAQPATGLRLTGDPQNGSDLYVRVLSTPVTGLFGVAFHVTYPADLEAQNVMVMPALGVAPLTLMRQTPGDLAFGISQADPKNGNADLSDGAQLASFVLHAPGALVQGRLELARVIGRSADAGFVDLGSAGASVAIGGAP